MSTDVQELTAKAKLLVSERNYQEAVRICRRVLLSHPDEIPVRLLLGSALLALKRYEEARVEMLALLRTAPREAAVHRLLGETYLRDNKPDRARESLRTALELDPGDDEARALLSEVDSEPSGSQTLDRWFDPNAVATVQTGAPEFEEEHTGPIQLPAIPAGPETPGPSVEIDSSLAAEVDIERFDRRGEPAPSPPARARIASVPPSAGAPAAIGPAVTPPRAPPPKRPRSPSQFPPPPAAGQAAAGAALVIPAPEPDTGARTHVPRRADDVITNPREEPVTMVRPDLEVPAQLARSRPQRKKLPPKEPTQELDLEEMGALDDEETEEGSAMADALTREVGNAPELDAEATRARASPTGYDGVDDDDERPDAGGVDDGLEMELVSDPGRTVARPAAGRSDGEVTRQAGSGKGPRPRRPTPVSTPAAAPAGRGGHGGGPTKPLPSYDEAHDSRGFGGPRAEPPSAPGWRDEMADEGPRPRYPSRPPGARPRSERPAGRGPMPVPMPRPDPASGEAPFDPFSTPPVQQPQVQPRPIAGRGPGSARSASSGQVTEHGVVLTGRERIAALVARAGEKRQLVIAAAIAAPILVGLVAFFAIRAYLSSSAEAEVQAAVERASDDGLKASVERAIGLAAQEDEPAHVALAARLVSTLVLEHGEDREADAMRLLESLEDEDAQLPDARIARAYLLLADGEVDGARRIVADVSASGETAAEASRARALANAAAGDLARAVTDARAAVQSRGVTSPRHVALYALLEAQDQDAGAGLAALDTVPNGDASPSIRLARARILQDSGRDPVRGVSEASAVLGDLAPLATPGQRGWAHLVRARHYATEGNFASALEEARAAAQSRPVADESFGLWLIETLLQAGAAIEARSELDHLPPTMREPERRARLTAEVALDPALNDFDRAEQWLARAGSSPRIALLRGRLFEGRGQLQEAKEQYERAAQDESQFVRARARLGAIELRRGNPRDAIALLDPARERNQFDFEVIPLLARALIATGEVERAETVVVAALNTRPRAPELLGARGAVELAKGDVDAALAALTTAAQLRPNDADLHALLGEAARRAGRNADAQRSYDQALQLAPNLPAALAGLVELAIDQGDQARASELLGRAEQGARSSVEVLRARARLEVLAGSGELAIPNIQNAARLMEDPVLWTMLGRLQVQAERDGDATTSFNRALQLDPRAYEAHLGLAIILIRRGSLGAAAQRIGQAERDGRTRHAPQAFFAQLDATRGRVQFENSDMAGAERYARQALQKDARCADAHLLLADVAIERNSPAEVVREALRNAATGRAPPPEAVGRLAYRLDESARAERCQLAHRYMLTAPRGYDAADIRAIDTGCQ